MLTTLNISSQEIKLAALKGRKVKCWTSQTLESGIVRDGRVLDPERLGDTIAQLFKTQKLPRNRVVAALSALPYTYRIIGFPPIKESQVEEAIMHALPDEFTIPVENLYLSWARLMTGPEGTDYFVLGVDLDLVDSFVQAMKLAGIKDWSMDLKPLALARAANATDAIIASLDLDHLDIVLVRGGYIKELHSAVPDQEGRRANFARYMDQFVAELVKILSFHHDSSGTSETEKALTELPILVTGEMIVPAVTEGEIPDEDKIIAMMSKLTGHSVSLIMPPVTGPETFNTNAYATNIGLFLKTRRRKPMDDMAPDRFHDVNIDILSGRFAKKPVMVPMWYTVAPVVVFLAVFGAWSFNSAYSENSAEMTRLRTDMEDLTATRAQMLQKADEQTKLVQQVTAAEDTLKQLQQQHQNLLAGKGNDTVYISDARSCLPAGASLTEIRVGINGVQLTGTVTDPFDVITYIRSLEAAGYKLNLQEIDKGGEGVFAFYINLKTGLAGGH
jgi:Tfp pilus assembly protein PilN